MAGVLSRRPRHLDDCWRAFLFNNLRSGAYINLFIALVMLRVALWMGMGVSSLLWYALRLEELKRDSLAVRS